MRRMMIVVAIASIGGLIAAACGPPGGPPGGSAPVGPGVPCLVDPGGADLTQLPIGDDCVGNTPAAGVMYTCNAAFPTGGPGGSGGPWINGDGTWDATSKLTVDGAVNWPSSFTITTPGTSRVFAGNELPDHPTGVYPVSVLDDAYQYDPNPGMISTSLSMSFSLEQIPTPSASAQCLPMGPIGVMLSGALLYNGVDALGRDAAVYEVLDDCEGHPQQQGQYHYHTLTDCVTDNHGVGHSELLGYAFDGFGIFGKFGVGGDVITNQDLDECHGHTHSVDWDGSPTSIYHYHATDEFPYVVGCFRAPLQVTPGQV
jgi:hypothetical protein